MSGPVGPVRHGDHMNPHGYGPEVMDLLIRYDSEHPATLGDMADRRAIYARRITEAVIRDTAAMVTEVHSAATVEALADAEVRGYKRGIQAGLELAQRLTGQDMTAALAILDGLDA